MKRISKLKGFTLIELLIVAAIIGVVTGITVPRVMEAREIAKIKALEGTSYPIILEMYNQEEYEEVISAFRYYNKYVNSKTMRRIIKRIE